MCRSSVEHRATPPRMRTAPRKEPYSSGPFELGAVNRANSHHEFLFEQVQPRARRPHRRHDHRHISEDDVADAHTGAGDPRSQCVGVRRGRTLEAGAHGCVDVGSGAFVPLQHHDWGAVSGPACSPSRRDRLHVAGEVPVHLFDHDRHIAEHAHDITTRQPVLARCVTLSQGGRTRRVPDRSEAGLGPDLVNGVTRFGGCTHPCVIAQLFTSSSESAVTRVPSTSPRLLGVQCRPLVCDPHNSSGHLNRTTRAAAGKGGSERMAGLAGFDGAVNTAR
jgi:hypothetical protein